MAARYMAVTIRRNTSLAAIMDRRVYSQSTNFTLNPLLVFCSLYVSVLDEVCTSKMYATNVRVLGTSSDPPIQPSNARFSLLNPNPNPNSKAATLPPYAQVCRRVRTLVYAALACACTTIVHSAAVVVYRSEGASEHLHTALHTATYTQYTTCALRTYK